MLYQLSYSRKRNVGRAGFEPTKAEPTDLQSAPFDRFGISPEISCLHASLVLHGVWDDKDSKNIFLTNPTCKK
jgi:hypothetical protein